MTYSAADHEQMARALRLARRGIYTTDPNPNVGCVVVSSDGAVVGEGWHERAGEAHAEVTALAQAGTHAAGAVAYVTLEPCSHHGRTPPCADALIDAGISRVVCAMTDPNPQVSGRGLEKLQAGGIKTEVGLLEHEARELNRGFVTRMERGRPWVCVKLAVSMDGRTALASGESKWITSAASRADVHRLRARSSAILTGIGTVIADNPQLTARTDGIDAVEQPLRVVVDSALRLEPDAALVTGDGAVLVCHATGDAAATGVLDAAEVAVLSLPGEDGRVCLESLLRELGRREINDVLVEAGPGLNGALLAAGLVDEWVVYQAPLIMGADARGMFAGQPVETMSAVTKLKISDVRHVGPDLRVIYRKP
jgi:diaminohydroxyphosphoribosylaminopyrimidine deaminase/5-amino-6-(5-phosphoribosylamino)uracil reductase